MLNHPIHLRADSTHASARRGLLNHRDPDNGVGYFNFGYDSVFLDRLGEAENAARAASERKIESPYLFLLRYDVAFAARTCNRAVDVALVKTQRDRVLYYAAGSPVNDFQLDRDKISLEHLAHSRPSHPKYSYSQSNHMEFPE
jgi:hypothetical protein